jgi:hypothetical protein
VEGHVCLNTAIPGPKSQNLLERRKRVIPKGISNGCTAFVHKAKGALVGLGREGGHHGMEEYLEVKYISIALDESSF